MKKIQILGIIILLVGLIAAPTLLKNSQSHPENQPGERASYIPDHALLLYEYQGERTWIASETGEDLFYVEFGEPRSKNYWPFELQEVETFEEALEIASNYEGDFGIDCITRKGDALTTIAPMSIFENTDCVEGYISNAVKVYGDIE